MLQRARVGERVSATTHVEVVLLSRHGRVEFATPRARRWLTAYFGESNTARLPRTLADWVRPHAAIRAGMPAVREPLMVTRDGGCLEVRLCEGSQQVLLVCERRRSVTPQSLESVGLSPREAQVLAWVAEGKTNSEISIILGIRPRTAAKHLERIFRKLGVETRTAAAAAVLTRSP